MSTEVIQTQTPREFQITIRKAPKLGSGKKASNLNFQVPENSLILFLGKSHTAQCPSLAVLKDVSERKDYNSNSVLQVLTLENQFILRPTHRVLQTADSSIVVGYDLLHRDMSTVQMRQIAYFSHGSPEQIVTTLRKNDLWAKNGIARHAEWIEKMDSEYPYFSFNKERRYLPSNRS